MRFVCGLRIKLRCLKCCEAMIIGKGRKSYADRMAKAFSTKMANNPVIAARALEHYFGRKLQDLLAELNSRNAPELDEEDDLDDDF